MSAHRDLAESFLDRVWGQGDPAPIYAMLSGETRISGLEEVELVSPQDFHAFHRMMTAQFTDIHHEIRQAVEQGDWLALLCDVTALHRETGISVKTRIHMMMRFQDGKIVEAHNQLDLIRIFETIGRLPERTLDLCLLGERLEVLRSA